MFTRIAARWPWFTHSGLVLLLVGLAWDGVLHRADPQLAAREGVFAPGNPGHVLLGAGIVLLLAGAVLHAAARALRPTGASAVRRIAALAPALAVLTLATVSFALAAGAEGVAGTGHDHSHVHEPEPAQDGHVHHHDADTAPAGGSEVDRLVSGLVHSHPTAPPMSASDLAFAAGLVQRVRAESGAYADVRAAEAAGYRAVTRGPLVHYTNPHLVADGRTLDPAQPESLLYLHRPGRSPQLVGVMFQTRPGQEPPAQGATVLNWHRHTNICLSASGTVAGLADQDGNCPPNSVLRTDTGSMIHVWLVDTPAGVFADGMEVAPYLLGRRAGTP